jgi:nucleoside-diphosphate-sugar epimerase
MKVLVTGADGFLGKAIVEEFLSKGVEVIGVSRSSGQFKADITIENSLEQLSGLNDVETVIHSAGLAHQFGKTPREKFFAVNVKGTENVLKTGKKLNIRHFILISSVAVYGDNSKLRIPDSEFQEDAECNPFGDYAESKYQSEVVAKEFCRNNKINLTILRPATIIGEGDKGNVSRLITTIKNGRFKWIGKGQNLKSLIYKNDVAEACFSVFQKQNSEFQVYNLSAMPIRMKDVVETAANELNVKIPKFYVPQSVAEIIAKFSGTIRKWLSDDVFSGGKIKSELDFQPQTDIKEAIGREVRSFES